MKRLMILCLLLITALPSWSAAAPLSPARISFISGDISFRTPDSDEWLPAAVNTPLDEGDTLWCAVGSRVEVQLADGSVLRLAGDSQIDVLAIEEGFTHLHLDTGRMYLRTTQGLKENALQIDADDTTVLPAGRTRLTIDMLPNSTEDVAILKGSAYVEGSGSRTRVRAGEHIMLEERHSEILPLNPADSWELWNLDRDREQSRSSRATGNLPEELRPYAAEMETNGSWVSVPEYGMVWRPTVVVSSDWAPYREGRWIWKGDDYIWISFETWGWLPYHYGRWAVVTGFGWCWVPPARGDVYWGPGYVGWYRTGAHIGWTPLAPGETFYGRRHYGRHSVNITTVNVNTTTVIYRNRNHRGGMTVLPQDDFLHGRYGTPRAGVRTPDITAVLAGSPRIKPLRETRMPVVKPMPSRPVQQKIEKRDYRELREKFPRIRPEQDNHGPHMRSTPPGVAPSVAPGQPAPRPGRERGETIQPDRSGGRSNPPVLPSPKPGGKSRDEIRPGATESRDRIPAGKPVPQAQPPQRNDERRGTPAVPPDSRGTKPSDSKTAPGGSPRSLEDKIRNVPPPTTGSQGRQTPGVSRSEERVNVPSPAKGIQPRTEKSQTDGATPAAGATRSVPQPQRTEQPKREPQAREPQPRQIWRVTTPEPAAGAGAVPTQEREGRGRERR